MTIRTLTMAIGALALLVSAVQAQEVTLKGASAFDAKSRFSAKFEAMVDRINAEGKGTVQINYLGGGAKVMSPFQLGNAVKTGVVDIAQVPGAFYVSLVPEADTMKLSQLSMAEMRKNGAYDYFERLHNEKINAHLLARTTGHVPFYLYTNKPIDKPDLTGLKMRVTPIYQAFFAAMGATTVTTAPGEVYTALERGTVDGYGFNPSIVEFGWQAVTKFRLDIPFYEADLYVLVNLDTWKKLTPGQKGVIEKHARWAEESAASEEPASVRSDLDKQAAAGIKAITFTPENRKKFLDLAYEEGWKGAIKANPEHGPKLRDLLTKK
ncbi:MAG: ABC transporter substrate-binding protein [Alphaproteobacteria bacterium]|nr:ABC transporter substrate-binding protein [Alphaproteobacteria bacterium]